MSLNSLSGISLNVTPRPLQLFHVLPCCLSQFPFWDFFECNKILADVLGKRFVDLTLNSLSGISLNVTRKHKDKARHNYRFFYTTLNSLSGISLNVTDAVSAVFRGIGGENQRVIPLTPHLQRPL